MGFYNDRILPHLIALTMRNGNLVACRERVVSRADGRVLEVGIGAGATLPFYSSRVREIIGLEPAPRLVAMAQQAVKDSRAPVSFVATSAEAIPLDDASIDTVMMTWTLCSVPDAARALAEIRRVLKPGGRLLFVEHGLAPEERVQKWQHRLTPFWKRNAGGCHLNRAISALVEDTGFRMERLETGYMHGRPETNDVHVRGQCSTDLRA